MAQFVKDPIRHSKAGFQNKANFIPFTRLHNQAQCKYHKIYSNHN